jgi:hypothetical protein
MTERSGHVLETLREGVEFALYRRRQHGYPNPVLVLAPVAEHPSPRTLCPAHAGQQLRRECG